MSGVRMHPLRFAPLALFAERGALGEVTVFRTQLHNKTCSLHKKNPADARPLPKI